MPDIARVCCRCCPSACCLLSTTVTAKYARLSALQVFGASYGKFFTSASGACLGFCAQFEQLSGPGWDYRGPGRSIIILAGTLI